MAFLLQHKRQAPCSQTGIVGEEHVHPMLDRHFPRVGGTRFVVDWNGSQTADRLARSMTVVCSPVPRATGAHFCSGSRPHFFHPGDLGGEASDLGVEFFGLLLVGCLLDLSFAFLFEEVGQPGNGSGFPGADLVGMDGRRRALDNILRSVSGAASNTRRCI
jgi:hypothetical protein